MALRVRQIPQARLVLRTELALPYRKPWSWKKNGDETALDETAGGLRPSIEIAGRCERLGRASGHRGEGDVALTLGGDRVIAPVRMVFTRHAFFLDVDHLPRAGDVPIASDYAATRQRGEPDDANHAHCWCFPCPLTQQLLCRSKSGMIPRESQCSSQGLCFKSWHFLHTWRSHKHTGSVRARSRTWISLR